jgi:hypothetical protein
LIIFVSGLALSPVSASNGYNKYEGSFKLKHDTYMAGYDITGYKKEWRSGQKGKYQASAEIYMYKKGKKVKKYSTLRVAHKKTIYVDFKAVVKYRYWNGYKYTNKYKTRTSYCHYGKAYAKTYTTNWIPYIVKVYSK